MLKTFSPTYDPFSRTRSHILGHRKSSISVAYVLPQNVCDRSCFFYQVSMLGHKQVIGTNTVFIAGGFLHKLVIV